MAHDGIESKGVPAHCDIVFFLLNLHFASLYVGGKKGKERRYKREKKKRYEKESKKKLPYVYNTNYPVVGAMRCCVRCHGRNQVTFVI